MCNNCRNFEKFKSLIKIKREKYDKIALLAKAKLISIEVLLSRAFIDSYIVNDEFILINNVSKEYGDVKEGIKNLKTL